MITLNISRLIYQDNWKTIFQVYQNHGIWMWGLKKSLVWIRRVFLNHSNFKLCDFNSQKSSATLLRFRNTGIEYLEGWNDLYFGFNFSFRNHIMPLISAVLFNLNVLSHQLICVAGFAIEIHIIFDSFITSQHYFLKYGPSTPWGGGDIPQNPFRDLWNRN